MTVLEYQREKVRGLEARHKETTKQVEDAYRKEGEAKLALAKAIKARERLCTRWHKESEEVGKESAIRWRLEREAKGWKEGE